MPERYELLRAMRTQRALQRTYMRRACRYVMRVLPRMRHAKRCHAAFARRDA